MKCLVTGGAGFVGSHVVLSLLDAGHSVAVLDNLSTGHLSAVSSGARFFNVDLADAAATEEVVGSEQWDAVLHFAALSLVSASIRNPLHYLHNNYITALNLIRACVHHGVPRFVFSSTAALFGGTRESQLIADNAFIDPSSPYGESKFFIERTLLWADRIHGMRSACLRYFNAAGADPLGRLGEDHHPETHLIPLTIDSMLGRHPGFKLFGNDYPTPDGTCIRDYVHVTDLADAHIRVLEPLETHSVTYNLGNGIGFSNLEVVQSVERISGRKIPWTWGARRAGDPAILVADSTRFCQETGWNPKFRNLDQIVETALLWREAHPQGYQKKMQNYITTL